MCCTEHMVHKGTADITSRRLLCQLFVPVVACEQLLTISHTFSVTPESSCSPDAGRPQQLYLTVCAKQPEAMLLEKTAAKTVKHEQTLWAS